MKLKITARVILKGSYKNNKLKVDNNIYDCRLNNTYQELLDRGELDLTGEKLYILVPHTLPFDSEIKYMDDYQQKPYLGFTVIGIVKNQPDVVTDTVNITGKVIYENMQHEFVLVKIWKNAYKEIIKLNGLLNDSNSNGRGTAVDNIYSIVAKIEDNSLYIEDSWKEQVHYGYRDNVIPFPQRKYQEAA